MRIGSLRTMSVTPLAGITQGKCKTSWWPIWILYLLLPTTDIFINLTISTFCRLYLESDYGQRTDREEGLDTDVERAERSQAKK